jgi:putative alpha-1,2-mannosidase
MGLFPTYVGSTDFDIFTPQFPMITLNFGDAPFKIQCKNFGDGNIYIQQAYLNKQPLPEPSISYSEIKKGGILELILGAEPNPNAFKN